MIMNSYVTFHDLWIHIWIHVYEEYRKIIPEFMCTKVPDVQISQSAWGLLSSKIILFEDCHPDNSSIDTIKIFLFLWPVAPFQNSVKLLSTRASSLHFSLVTRSFTKLFHVFSTDYMTLPSTCCPSWVFRFTRRQPIWGSLKWKSSFMVTGKELQIQKMSLYAI